MKKYCLQDVDILRKAFLKFRELFLQSAKVDVKEACTIAMACMNAFRKEHLKENTIGLIPPGGYRWQDRQSFQALKYLRCMEKKHEIKIQSTDNTGEVKIAGYKVCILWIVHII